MVIVSLLLSIKRKIYILLRQAVIILLLVNMLLYLHIIQCLLFHSLFHLKQESKGSLSEHLNLKNIKIFKYYHIMNLVYRCDTIKKKKIDDATQFRNSPKWQKKRKQIKERDNYLCQICIREIYGTKRKYNHENLQVHHAIPINTNEDLKLDESNLFELRK